MARSIEWTRRDNTGEISELHAYLYVEARQITNYLADNKPPNTRLPRQGHDFLIASSNETPVHYS